MHSVFSNTRINSILTNLAFAALIALAVLAILATPGMSASSGSVTMTDQQAVALGQQINGEYGDSSKGGGSGGGGNDGKGCHGDCYQPDHSYGRGHDPVPTPEPSSALMIGIAGGVGLVWILLPYRRRTEAGTQARAAREAEEAQASN